MQIVITTGSNNIIKSVQQVLNENKNYQGIMIETTLDINTIYLVDNYKLVGNTLIELTEEEKQIDICPPKTTEEHIAELYVKLDESKTANEALAQYVSDLEINLIIEGVV